jgi:hypothetical protein
MITGKEYLKENIEKTNIPEEHYTNEIGEMMEWYADDYHKELVKNLTIRELLIAYDIKINKVLGSDDDTQRKWSEQVVDKYISNL